MARSRKSVDGALSEALLAAGVTAHAAATPGPVRPLAVAFSGGLDSTVLLHAAARVLGPARVLALHVHHGLQPAADRWVAHCTEQAHGLGVACRALRARGAPGRGDSVEQWARVERYALLMQAARDAQAAALLTAHHADDQLETVLLALARGCGLDGLTGIAARDLRDGVLLLRPLLVLDRAALLQDALERGLAWVEDPSNRDESLPRNAVRARVLPVLRTVLPQLGAQLPDALAALREARETVDAVAACDLAAAVRAAVRNGPPPGPVAEADRSAPAVPPPGLGRRASAVPSATLDRRKTAGSNATLDHRTPAAPIAALDRSTLAALPPARQSAALRGWLAALGAPPPSRTKLAEMRAQLVTGEAPHAELVHAGWRLLRYRDLLCAARPEALVPMTPARLRWRGEPELALPGGGRLRFLPVESGLDPAWLQRCELRIAAVPSSQRLRIDPRRPSRTLKNLRQEAGVPSWLRARFPGVWVDARLLLAAPFGMDRDPAWPTTRPGVAVRWSPADADVLCAAFEDPDPPLSGSAAAGC